MQFDGLGAWHALRAYYLEGTDQRKANLQATILAARQGKNETALMFHARLNHLYLRASSYGLNMQNHREVFLNGLLPAYAQTVQSIRVLHLTPPTLNEVLQICDRVEQDPGFGKDVSAFHSGADLSEMMRLQDDEEDK
jgi:hypothetical protein